MRIIIIALLMLSQFVEAKRSYTTIPKWKMIKGEIDYKSVCYNYKKNSIKYRECRGHASEVFKTRCNKTKERIYCLAKEKYKIID